MLLRYGASNFFCFNEGIEISFELNANCPSSISKGKAISNVICVKGANGSGKTNALRIIAFIADFCCNSFAKKPNEKIYLESFFGSTEPTELFIDFIIDSVEYRYELVLTTKTIISEKIYRIKKRSTLIVERGGNKLVNNIKEFDELKIMKLRANASMISTANQYEVLPVAQIYNFFNSIIPNIGTYTPHLLTIDNQNISTFSEIYHNNPEYFEFAKEIICKSDVGVSDIKIQVDKDPEGKKEFYPLFAHRNQESTHVLNLYSQSSGTQSLYFELFRYKTVLLAGGVLVLDEFDTKLHPHILPALVNLFTNEKTNPLNAQLIFTTHNSDIMEEMGKYRTVLINKDDNESFGYRLDEIPGDIIRNDRLIAPVYNSGKIGGVPKIRDFEV